MNKEDLKNLFNMGLRVFPIMKDSHQVAINNWQNNSATSMEEFEEGFYLYGRRFSFDPKLHQLAVYISSDLFVFEISVPIKSKEEIFAEINDKFTIHNTFIVGTTNTLGFKNYNIFFRATKDSEGFLANVDKKKIAKDPNFNRAGAEVRLKTERSYTTLPIEGFYEFVTHYPVQLVDVRDFFKNYWLNPIFEIKSDNENFSNKVTKIFHNLEEKYDPDMGGKLKYKLLCHNTAYRLGCMKAFESEKELIDKVEETIGDINKRWRYKLSNSYRAGLSERNTRSRKIKFR